ncbi:hypothetical protein [uncultured Lamprocystis sp.]|uniref:hypothetical protein n=1 Tax=uncultured Lamprocystis sp. TaxID=543132 RepID=UPI00342A4638
MLAFLALLLLFPLTQAETFSGKMVRIVDGSVGSATRIGNESAYGQILPSSGPRNFHAELLQPRVVCDFIFIGGSIDRSLAASFEF